MEQVKDEEDIGHGNDKLLLTFDVFGKLFMVRIEDFLYDMIK